MPTSGPHPHSHTGCMEMTMTVHDTIEDHLTLKRHGNHHPRNVDAIVEKHFHSMFLSECNGNEAVSDNPPSSHG